MKIRENFGAANQDAFLFWEASLTIMMVILNKLRYFCLVNWRTLTHVLCACLFLINRIFVNIARNYKDEDIFNQPRRRWESSSFVSFLGCSDARSRRLERLCFLKIYIYKLKVIINQSGQDDQRDYVSCNVVISVMNRTLQVFNEWKQIIWVFSIPGILFPNASIVFKSPWWLTVFSFEIQDNML